MRSDTAIIGQYFHGFQVVSANAGVIGDGLAVQGDVEVATHEDALALKVGGGEVLNALLGALGGGGGRDDGRGDRVSICSTATPPLLGGAIEHTLYARY